MFNVTEEESVKVLISNGRTEILHSSKTGSQYFIFKKKEGLDFPPFSIAFQDLKKIERVNGIATYNPESGKFEGRRSIFVSKKEKADELLPLDIGNPLELKVNNVKEFWELSQKMFATKKRGGKISNAYAGYLFTPENVVVCTDLERVIANRTDCYSVGKEIVVPAENFKTAKELFRNQKFAIKYNKKNILFYNEKTEYSFNLLENEFSNYKAIVGNIEEHRENLNFIPDVNKFKEILKDHIEFNGKRRAYLRMTEKEDFLVCKTQTDVGNIIESETEIKLETGIKPDIPKLGKSVAVNTIFLQDFVKNVKPKKIGYIIEEGLRPLILIDGNFFYMIMPVKVKW